MATKLEKAVEILSIAPQPPSSGVTLPGYSPVPQPASRHAGRADALCSGHRGRLGHWLLLFADSDEAGHAFQCEAGRVFRSEAGHPWRRSHGVNFMMSSRAGKVKRPVDLERVASAS